MNSKNINPNPIDNAVAIVKAQGALFIREFLRNQKNAGMDVKIGSTKTNSLENLTHAIDNKYITLADLDEWIQQVEGWGKQHVYLYELPATTYRKHQKSPRKTLTKAINDSDYHTYLNKSEQFNFPKKLELQQISINGESLEVIWRQRSSDSLRTPSHDPEKKYINGDLYEFKAYRITPSRNVMRFLFVPKTNTSALFIQLPLGVEHRLALETAEKLITKLFGLKTLVPKNLSRTIKALDNIDLYEGEKPINLEAHSTKFTADGAAVEFSASKHISGFKQVESVRLVRKAMVEEDFDGESGQFNIHLGDNANNKRTIQMTVSALNNKFYFKAQMNATEMKRIMNYLVQL